MVLKKYVKDEFQINPIVSTEMEKVFNISSEIYSGCPKWVTDDVKTINFAKAVCSETARLAMLATGINIDGSARAEWLQKQIEDIYYDIREWVEYGCAYGTVILKPDGDTIEVVTPDNFVVTDIKNKNIVGAVFSYNETSEDGKEFFTRLEWHRFEGDLYLVTNKCYKSTSKNAKPQYVSIDKTPWKGLMEHVAKTEEYYGK